ncbi:MAG: spermidine/putrescine ABC transporter substrate-binding protein [bacterium]|nr:spermidine/putrescine ABC transporter substrate-binding protein [bacterium]
MIKRIYLQLLVRISMIAMVTGAIGLFLYSPRFFNFLRTEKSISIFTWPQIIDTSFLDEFERQTGIKVHIRYFGNNEELLMKLELMREGYDLVMPSDFMVPQLIEKGLIKKIDKTKLDFWHTLYPALLGHYFDPNNEYTIPYYWGIYGLGIDRDYFKGKKISKSWSLLFDERLAPPSIVMVDGARELTLIAAYYLFGPIDKLTPQQISLIKQLLQKQKKWVYAYTDLRAEYLVASKTVPVALVLSADIAAVMPYFEHVDFVVPQEGSFWIIDSFALSSTSKKEELVYQFLNYIYRAGVLQKYVDKFGFFPPTTNVQPTFSRGGLSIPSEQVIKKLYFFKNIVPEEVLNEIWIALKA